MKGDLTNTSRRGRGNVLVSEEAKTPKRPTPPDGISLMVSTSKMRTTVDVDAEHAKDWSPDRLRQYLMAEGVVHGIDEQTIGDLFAQKLFNQAVAVAKGTLPKNGENGSIRYHIDVDCLRGRPRVLETGRVDHRNLGLFQSVEEGQLLAERVPPTPGVPGRDVYGNEIPGTDGKEAKLTGGKNTRLSEDGNRLLAAIQGCLTGTPEKIDVIHTLAISGDVSYKTGNIASNVAVLISGGVLPEFSIKSNEDVNIAGLVDGAEIVSGGRIAINAGIQGGGKAVLTAKKGILARFANEAALKSNGDIVIQGPVTHCRVETQGHLIAEGGKGVILGGQIHANQGVTADTIGSEMGAKTLITVGPKLQELNEKISEMEGKRNSLLSNAARLAQLLRVFAVVKKEQQRLPAEKIAMAVKVKKTYEVLRTQVKQIEAEIQQLIAERQRLAQVKRSVNVKGITWPGTQIRILNAIFVPKAPMKGCTFVLIDNEIRVFAYRELSERTDTKTDEEKDATP